MQREILAALLACGSLAAAQSLAAPTGVTASDDLHQGIINVAWEHTRGAKLYRIFRGTTNDPKVAVEAGTSLSIQFADFGAPPNVRHFYWVRADDGSGTISAFSAPDMGSCTAQPPGSAFGIAFLERQVPAGNPVTAAKVYLGKTLFWDEQLSSSRTTACGTCHRGRAGGSDPRSEQSAEQSVHPGRDGVFGTDDDAVGSRGIPRSRADGTYRWSPSFGLREQVTRRKALSIVNSVFAHEGIRGFDGLLWNGRAEKEFRDPVSGEVLFADDAFLESQAVISLLDSTEMAYVGRTWDDVVARVAGAKPLALAPEIPAALGRWIEGRGYPELFAEAFGSPEVSPSRIAMALASYERTLVSDETREETLRAGSQRPTPAELAGSSVSARAGCNVCHSIPLTASIRFRGTGVQRVEDDLGQGEIHPGLEGVFRTPPFRNTSLQGPMFHNGSAKGLEDVVEFYSRGGNFKIPVDPLALTPRNFTRQEKADLVTFLRTHFEDLRVANDLAPIFDRPMLYSESARRPAMEGTGVALPGGLMPEAIAVEPPFSGNPNFTIGLWNVPPGSRAVLVIDGRDPGSGPGIPTSASFARREVAVEAGDGGAGFASVALPIPADSDLLGATLFARWFVVQGEQVGVSRAIRFTVFGTEHVVEGGFVSTSAAGLTKGLVAPESIVSGFGSGLAAEIVTAEEDGAARSLGGVEVVVTDRTGAEFAAGLFFVSPGQINYLLPEGIAKGEAQVRVMREGAAVARGTIQVGPLAPALFSANADGLGTAAALVQQVSADGILTSRNVARFDAGQNRLVSDAIDLAAAEETYLVLFGTGIRRNQGNLRATVAGLPVDVLYAGPQLQFEGLDQVNLRFPKDFPRGGEVDILLWVDGEMANRVRVNLR